MKKLTKISTTFSLLALFSIPTLFGTSSLVKAKALDEHELVIHLGEGYDNVILRVNDGEYLANVFYYRDIPTDIDNHYIAAVSDKSPSIFVSEDDFIDYAYEFTSLADDFIVHSDLELYALFNEYPSGEVMEVNRIRNAEVYFDANGFSQEGLFDFSVTNLITYLYFGIYDNYNLYLSLSDFVNIDNPEESIPLRIARAEHDQFDSVMKIGEENTKVLLDDFEYNEGVGFLTFKDLTASGHNYNYVYLADTDVTVETLNDLKDIIGESDLEDFILVIDRNSPMRDLVEFAYNYNVTGLIVVNNGSTRASYNLEHFEPSEGHKRLAFATVDKGSDKYFKESATTSSSFTGDDSLIHSYYIGQLYIDDSTVPARTYFNEDNSYDSEYINGYCYSGEIVDKKDLSSDCQLVVDPEIGIDEEKQYEAHLIYELVINEDWYEERDIIRRVYEIPTIFTLNYAVDWCMLDFSANGGFGRQSDDQLEVERGSTFTLPANEYTAPSGFEFKGWKIGDKVYQVGEDYRVEDDTIIEAYWEEIRGPVDNGTPAKKGLSGGAIAGIVIGSIFLLSLAGFAVYWFIIKKKSFKDLVAVFKKK